MWNYGVRYHLTAKLARPEGDVFVHIGVWQDSRPYAEYDVIEVKRMMTGLATVNAAALAEISKLLQQDASLKIYVVGHTDNVGALASNMDLSRRRADAVVKVLIAKYNIPAARLNAQGAGPIAPVASNDTEEGRAKNRRVELVKQ